LTLYRGGVEVELLTLRQKGVKGLRHAYTFRDSFVTSLMLSLQLQEF